VKLVLRRELMANQLAPRNHGRSASRILKAGKVTRAREPRRPQILLLDRNITRSYKRGIMMKWARVALALVVVFTIAYVLITPDPTDDVYGVLPPNHPALAQKVPAVSLWEFQVPIAVIILVFTLPGTFTRPFADFELLDIISVCRC